MEVPTAKPGSRPPAGFAPPCYLSLLTGIKPIESTDASFFRISGFVVDLVVEPGSGDVF